MQKALTVAVVVMGVLIVGGTITLGVLMARRMSGGSTGFASGVLLDEPSGTRIAGVSAAPDQVMVQLQGGGADRVVVIDTRSGRVLGRIWLARP